MTSDLYDQILEAIEDRNAWATRQDGFYRMRFKGIKRQRKPYPGAPDMKYGLPDALIEKLKSLYVQQLYANDVLANFVSTQPQDGGATTDAANWFDYQLKQQSNFERAMFIGIDKMLEAGFIVMKIFWNPETKQICFDPVDPLHIIVPKSTEELGTADFLVNVMTMSVGQYKRNPLYNQVPDFIKSITGRGEGGADTGDNAKGQSKDLREGLTCGANDNEIVLWEVFRRDSDNADAKIVVDTISPVLGWDDDTPDEDMVRATFGLPFKHRQIPFVKIRMELTDKGWYSTRGVTEIVAPQETGLCKVWNSKLQWLDFFSNPTFAQEASSQLSNYKNYQSQPGSVLPPGLTPVPAPPAPVELESEMQFLRALAEDRIAVPDLSASEHLSGNPGVNGNVTATQINAIVGQSGQSSDLRARVFRLDVGVVYEQSWSVLVQYKSSEWDFILSGDVKQVPQAALHTNYIITPNGSPDSWNKAAKVQSAFSLYQVLSGSPYINKGEALKWLMEQVTDPSLIKRLYEDPGEQMEDQAEQQAQEISIMLLGYPAKVNQADDDKTHLQTLGQFVQRRLTTGEQVTPEAARLFLMHGAAHVQALQEKKDPMLRQVVQQTGPITQALQQVASQPDQMPPNVTQMSPSAGSVPALPSAGPAAGAPPMPEPPPNANDIASTNVAIGNMLANLIKSGVQISANDVNPVLQRLGLPPLASGVLSSNAIKAADTVTKHLTAAQKAPQVAAVPQPPQQAMPPQTMVGGA